MAEILEALRARVLARGLDICEPFQVKDYNALVHPRWALEDLIAARNPAPPSPQVPISTSNSVSNSSSNSDPIISNNSSDSASSLTSLGIVIGASKHFWPHFLEWLSSLDKIPVDPIDKFNTIAIEEFWKPFHPFFFSVDDQIPVDPIDKFNTIAIEEALQNEEFKHVKFEIRHAWANPKTIGKKFAHMQTAGHVAGVAYYDKETFWSLHPTYGTWFVYRAVVIFDIPFPKTLGPALPKQIVFPPESYLELKALTDTAKLENWANVATLLKIRVRSNVDPKPTQWQYEGDLLDYFYPINRTREQVLKDSVKTYREDKKSSY